jgi:hypothetical protein
MYQRQDDNQNIGMDLRLIKPHLRPNLDEDILPDLYLAIIIPVIRIQLSK